MPRLVDSLSSVRVSVRVDRFEESTEVGSIALGPTDVRCSQLVKPGSVEPALTCGSCRSAPEDGARVSAVQPVLVTGAAEVARTCGVKVDTYIDRVAAAVDECLAPAVVLCAAVVWAAWDVVFAAVVLPATVVYGFDTPGNVGYV
jgi:hypothetical protein